MADRNKKGHFQKGHSLGKKPGTRSQKAKDWDTLRELILGHHTEQFNRVMDELWDSSKVSEKKLAAHMFVQILKFFKPQMASIAIEEVPKKLTIEIVKADKLDPYEMSN